MLGSDHRELRVTINLVGFFRPENIAGIPIVNIAANLNFDVVDFEQLDLVDSTLAIEHAFPAIVDFATEWSYQPPASDDHTPLHEFNLD
jgi:hypothetical protein